MNEENNNVVENNNPVESSPVVETNNVGKPKKNNTALLIIIILVLVIGGLCILFFATDIFKSKENKKEKKENTAENVVLTPQEKKETYKEYTGIYKNGNTVLKVFFIDQDDYSLIYYDLENNDKNSSYSSYAEVNQIVGGTLKDSIFETTVKLTFKDGNITIETNDEDYDNGKYTKSSEYSEDKFYEDHYGELELLKCKYCGVYSSDNKKIMLYQVFEGELSFDVFVNDKKEFGSTVSLENATEDTIEEKLLELNDEEIIVKLTYTDGTLDFNVTGEYYKDYIGTYKKDRDVTAHDVLTSW